MTCLLLAFLTAQADPALESFEKQVRPVLHARCVSCHGPDKQKGGLRVDSRAALLKGGDSGPALVAGYPEKSLLLKAVRQTDPDLIMPPRKSGPRLPDDALRRRAVRAGWFHHRDGARKGRPARRGADSVSGHLRRGAVAAHAARAVALDRDSVGRPRGRDATCAGQPPVVRHAGAGRAPTPAPFVDCDAQRSIRPVGAYSVATRRVVLVHAAWSGRGRLEPYPRKAHRRAARDPSRC